MQIAQKLQRDYGNQYFQRLVRHNSRQSELVLQTKLTVGPTGDQYEQEADRVAKQVIGMTSSDNQKPAAQRRANEEELQMKPLAQRQVGAEGGGVDPDVEESIHQARGHGQPLPKNVRNSMEGAFGADFGEVRIHTGGNSDSLNDRVGARAFTTGQDIFFRQGEYNPASPSAREVLAHELTHVVQQSGEIKHTVDHQASPGTIHRHASWEHRMLGDADPDTLEIIASARDRAEAASNAQKEYKLAIKENGASNSHGAKVEAQAKGSSLTTVVHYLDQEIERLKIFASNPPTGDVA
jgi:hypothetical protein